MTTSLESDDIGKSPASLGVPKVARPGEQPRDKKIDAQRTPVRRLPPDKGLADLLQRQREGIQVNPRANRLGKIFNGIKQRREECQDCGNGAHELLDVAQIDAQRAQK